LSYPIDIWVGAGGSGGLGAITNNSDGLNGGDGHDTILLINSKELIVANGGKGGEGGKMWNNIPGVSSRNDGVALVRGGLVLSHYIDTDNLIIGGPGGYGRSSKTDPAYDIFGYMIPPIDSHDLPYGFITNNQPIRDFGQFNIPSNISPTGGGGGGGYVSTNLLNMGLLDANVPIPGGKILQKNKYTNELNPMYSLSIPTTNISFYNTVIGMGGDGGSIQSSQLPQNGNNYGGGGGGGGASRNTSAQNGGDGADGMCIIIEKNRKT